MLVESCINPFSCNHYRPISRILAPDPARPRGHHSQNSSVRPRDQSCNWTLVSEEEGGREREGGRGTERAREPADDSTLSRMVEESRVDKADSFRTTESFDPRQLSDHSPSPRNTVSSLHHCLKRKRIAVEEAPPSELSMNQDAWRRHLNFPEASMMGKPGVNRVGDDNKSTYAAATAAATCREGLQAFGEQNITNSSATTVPTAGSAVPTLVRHIPDQYSSLSDQAWLQQPSHEMGNTSYCYRHHPDLKCRRQADESSMQSLQKVSAQPQPPCLLGSRRSTYV